jgi:hypothetical protein
MKFLNHIDLNKTELRNAALQVLGTAPSSPVLGQTYFDSADLQIKSWNGSAWINKATDALLLGGQNGAYYLNRNNHSGTQALSTITMATARLAGRTSASTGAVEEISVGNGLSLSSSSLAMASMAAFTLKGNDTGATGDAVDLTVTQVRSLLSISNVDNTSDANKPISTAVATALSEKQESDTTLTALAALNATAGLLEQTGVDTFTKRSIGVSAASDILTRGDGDTRFVAIAHDGAGGSAHSLVVSGGAAGFMAGADKQKLDGIAAGATANDTDVNLRDRTTHTGSQPASTISDLASVVQAYRLDQFASPTASLSVANQKITNLASPTSDTDAANRAFVISQVQAAATGISVKDPVRVVAIANTALTGLQTVDGVALIAGDRVLLVGQTDAKQNGVYVAAAGAWSRPATEDETAELKGAFWLVNEGTLREKTQWIVNNDTAPVLGTDDLVIVQFGATTVYTASTGVELVGSDFRAKVVTSGGLTTGAGGLAVDTAIVARKFAATIGDGAQTSIAINHGLGTFDVSVSVRDAGTNAGVFVDWTATDANTVTLSFAVAPSANSYKAVIVG